MMHIPKQNLQTSTQNKFFSLSSFQCHEGHLIEQN